MTVNGTGFGFYVAFGDAEPPKKQKKKKQPKNDFYGGFPNYIAIPAPRVQQHQVTDAAQPNTPFFTPSSSYASSHLPTPPASPPAKAPSPRPDPQPQVPPAPQKTDLQK